MRTTMFVLLPPVRLVISLMNPVAAEPAAVFTSTPVERSSRDPFTVINASCVRHTFTVSCAPYDPRYDIPEMVQGFAGSFVTPARAPTCEASARLNEPRALRYRILDSSRERPRD